MGAPCRGDDDGVNEEELLSTRSEKLYRPRESPTKFKITSIAIIKSGLAIIAIIFSGLLFFPISKVLHNNFGDANHQSSQISQPCGNSTEEAVARGCTFDQLMWAWFPPGCPHYANEDYMSAAPWAWYIDPYEKKKIERGQWRKVLDNEITVYGEEQEHNAHCVYMFLNLAKIIRDDDDRYVPKHVDYEHLEHCAHLLMGLILKDENRNEVATKAGPVSYDQSCYL